MITILQKFQEDFHNAISIETKKNLLDNLINNTQPDNDEIIDIISDYQNYLKDFQETQAQIQDKQIIEDIDNGKYQLMTCIKSTDDLTCGNHYYVKIDDMRSQLMEQWQNNLTPVILNYINGIKSIIWVIVDDGLGTLKRKIKLDGECNQYFSL